MMEGAVSQIQRHTIIRFSYLGKNRGITWFDTEVDRINVLVKIHEVSEPFKPVRVFLINGFDTTYVVK